VLAVRLVFAHTFTSLFAKCQYIGAGLSIICQEQHCRTSFGFGDNKKEQERAELHRTIWGIANDLRGSVDGWDFKQYVLGMLFYRYISENLSVYINDGEHKAGDKSFSYAALTD
jgi:hypothetical protein